MEDETGYTFFLYSYANLILKPMLILYYKYFLFKVFSYSRPLCTLNKKCIPILDTIFCSLPLGQWQSKKIQRKPHESSARIRMATLVLKVENVIVHVCVD